MEQIIYDTDLISNAHSPVQDVFNYWANSTFPWLVKAFSEGIGVGAYIAGCDFTSGGVHFESDYTNDITISFDDLYHYMNLASQRYIINHPLDKAKIEQYLKAFRDRFLISSKK
ncbi:MAG: hypothetical protein Q4F00_07195 [bacterium]|nr:hypothetical protein [bacterium]